MVKRTCRARRTDGQPCRAAPLVGSDYCSVHDPANAEAMAEARRLGGLRSKRETTVRGAYEVEDLGSVGGVQRVVEIALVDALSLDSTPTRCCILLYGATVALKVIEVGQHEERLQALEAAMLAHKERHPSVFDQHDDLDDPFPLPGGTS
jgi:hypothetical protein